MTEDEFIQQALAQPLASDQFRPTNLHLDRTAGLRIDWADGAQSQYPLAHLRKRCPCASCRTEREQSARPQGLSLTILPANIEQAARFANASLVGNYAIQITWADGHSTGIYDFRYLRAIDPRNGPADGK